jgi:hypothetical protein
VIRSVEFDCVTLRERNQRFASMGGRMAQATREKAAREKTRETLAKHFGTAPGLWYTPAGAAPSFTDPNPITVRMWRVGPGSLDNDGPDDSMKNVRDGVADWLGIDDRSGAVDWPRAQQERVSAFTTAVACKVCGAGINVACRSGAVDLQTGKVAKMATGIHIARRTPWRVRIEVEDRTPGADRRVVLASEPAPVKRAKRRPKATPAGDPGEEVAARLLVPCPTCMAAVGAACRVLHHHDGPALAFGVHTSRAAAAGIRAMWDANFDHRHPPAAAARTGVRKMAARIAPPQQARLPLARVYALLPWRPREAIHEPRVDGLSPPGSLAYVVPEQHRATWGRTVTLYRQARTAAGLGIITVYALRKDR